MKERIEHIFDSIETMHPDSFTDAELNLLQSFEHQFQWRKMLSERQMEILEEIYRRGQSR